MSMSNNIAEGSGCDSDKEFARYLNIARSSTFENANIAIILQRRNVIDEKTKKDVLDRLELLCRKISRFRTSLSF